VTSCTIKETFIFLLQPQLLIETKMGNYFKFVNMNAMIFQDLLVLTFEKNSKHYYYFNPLSINQIKKITIIGTPKNNNNNLKNILFLYS